MIESRCGILCSELGCKEKFGFDCNGCVSEKTICWGVCPVKICCEDKNLNHCGECKSFPCEQLTAYSYDAEHGDNGARIKRCIEWTKCSSKNN